MCACVCVWKKAATPKSVNCTISVLLWSAHNEMTARVNRISMMGHMDEWWAAPLLNALKCWCCRYVILRDSARVCVSRLSFNARSLNRSWEATGFRVALLCSYWLYANFGSCFLEFTKTWTTIAITIKSLTNSKRKSFENYNANAKT